MTTPNLQLSEFGGVGVPSGAELSSTMRRLDAVVQLAVSAFVADPPAVPALGDRVIVEGPESVGTFAGHDLHIAYKTQLGWEFVIPEHGWVAFVGTPPVMYVFDASVPAWIEYEPERLTALKLNRVIGARFTGGGGAILLPTDEVQLEVPFSGIIKKCVISTEGGPGNLLLDIRKGANYPVSAFNSIVGGSPAGVEISAATYAEDTVLSGWDKDVEEGDWFSFSLEECSVFTAVTIQLFVEVPL